MQNVLPKYSLPFATRFLSLKNEMILLIYDVNDHVCAKLESVNFVVSKTPSKQPYKSAKINVKIRVTSIWLNPYEVR